MELQIKLVGICSVNRREWVQTDMATNSIGVTSVPLYETLGNDMLCNILDQTEMTTIFGSLKNLENILEVSA
jgi:long-subunit acyl-CoA synthetase (AMP-forming)